MNREDHTVRQHTVMLTDETWAATLRRATLEGKSAGELCEYLMSHYLSLEEEDRPPQYRWQDGVSRTQRSIHVSDPTWAGMKERKVLERRSVSEILEQLLRAYLGLDLTKTLAVEEEKAAKTNGI